MLIKLFGGAFIMLSSCVLGIYYSFKTDYRISDLIEMKKALLMLISEIEFNLSPLAEAMKNISSKVDIPACKIFYEFSKELEKKEGPAGEKWKKVLYENKEHTYFNKEDIDNLAAFGNSLGYLDRKQQKGNIKITVEYMENKISQLSKKAEVNKKMYRSLGFFGGAAVMIIFF